MGFKKHHWIFFGVAIFSITAGYFLAALKPRERFESAWLSVALDGVPLRMSLPELPRHTVAEVKMAGFEKPVKEGTYVAKDREGVWYAASLYNRGGGLSLKERQTLFEQGIHRLVSAHARNELLESRPVLFRGQEAREFLIQNQEDGSYESGVIVEYGEMLYTFLARYSPANPPPEGVARFFNSLWFAEPSSQSEFKEP